MQQRVVLVTLVVLIALLALSEGIGMPSGGGCCCGGGGGGGGGCGGGCGRKKREAVQPHYKADETPCPQAEWKEIIEGGIAAEDAIASVNAIQSGMYRRYADHKFLVTCATADEGAKSVANKVHFSSSGDGYCNVVKERVWCQAVALSA